MGHHVCMALIWEHMGLTGTYWDILFREARAPSARQRAQAAQPGPRRALMPPSRACARDKPRGAEDRALRYLRGNCVVVGNCQAVGWSASDIDGSTVQRSGTVISSTRQTGRA